MCPLSWSARMKICRLSRGRQRNDLFYRPSNNGSFSRIGSLHAAQWKGRGKKKKGGSTVVILQQLPAVSDRFRLRSR